MTQSFLKANHPKLLNRQFVNASTNNNGDYYQSLFTAEQSHICISCTNAIHLNTCIAQQQLKMVDVQQPSVVAQLHTRAFWCNNSATASNNI